MEHSLIKEIASGLGTGLFASACYEYLSSQRKARQLASRFSPLDGEYDEFQRVTDDQIVPTQGIVRLKYLGLNRFEISGLDTRINEFWRGEFFMSEECDFRGDGFYSYVQRDDVGTHRAIYNSHLKQFDVSGENLSHPYGNRSFKMIWRRKHL